MKIPRLTEIHRWNSLEAEHRRLNDTLNKMTVDFTNPFMNDLSINPIFGGSVVVVYEFLREVVDEVDYLYENG
jgi:hypothetical protein